MKLITLGIAQHYVWLIDFKLFDNLHLNSTENKFLIHDCLNERYIKPSSK